MNSDPAFTRLNILREVTRRRAVLSILVFLLHQEQAYAKEIYLMWGGSMKPVNSALAWLLKMHLIMTKPSQEPWVKEYYVLTPQGRRVAECVDKFLDEIMKIWAAVPGHKNTKLKS